jgi:hypothetical protein
MPTWIHELVVAPLAFALAFTHASRALGARRAALELAALTGYGFALEWVAMAVFGSHRYGASWILAPAGVPIAIAVVWAAVIVSAMTLAVRAGAERAVHRAALAAALGISLDLLMEPVAARLGLWEWTPHGPWLDVPIGNFVGWAVIVGGYTLGAELWPGTGAFARDAARRLALGAGAIGALVAIGLVWKAAGAERIFEGMAGWIAWGTLAVLPLLLARTPSTTRGPAGVSLAARLGAAPGPIPALMFALVAATFATDAVLLGGRDLALVAVGTLTGLIGAQKRAPDSLGRERRGGEHECARGGPQVPPELPT